MGVLAGERLDESRLTRALYSYDASLYRVVPRAVAQPRNTDELTDLLAHARAAGLPVTMRGAGTSCAGNAVGPGIVLDTSRHLTSIAQVEPGSRTARVEPGVVQAQLQRAAAPHGLRFGPDPSTHNRCTIGGMVGNNACGPRALGYGRTADNLVALDVITGTGEHLRLDTRTDLRAGDSPTLRRLHELVMANLGVIRTEFGRFSRQVSGYSLEHLLPEHGFDVTAFLAGSEGTLAVVSGAEVRLVRAPSHTVVVALGYPGMAEAADAVPAVLAHRPVALEGLDARIVDVARRRRPVPDLPTGRGWLFAELAGDDLTELRAAGARLVDDAGALAGRVLDDPAQAAALWRVRADGAGLAETSLGRPAYAGWEDAAVPPARLGGYLRDFEDLLVQHGLQAAPYGHFGEGCVHARIDFPLVAAGGPARLRAFLLDAAALAGSHGGSMSGEHGDGRARSELLPAMYSPAALALFAAVKQIFDPRNLLNPGVLVDPAPVDAGLRTALAAAPLALAHPGLAAGVHRCSGVGRCISHHGESADVMCPSYRATGDEKDSTRGRARILQELLGGTLPGGFAAAEVHEALDLCLACKGCARDCPTGVDLASYKSQVLAETYRGRRRPRSHYTLGQLPRWARLVSRTAGLAAIANWVLASPGPARLVRWLAGIDPRRSLPRFALRAASPLSLRIPIQGLDSATGGRGRSRIKSGMTEEHTSHPGEDRDLRPVALWVDSFSDCFEGTHLPALVTVLLDAGWAPALIDEPACCGLTWITTGQRDAATRQLRRAIDTLHPYAERGVPILGVEPSCLAVLRDDAAELIDDPRLPAVTGATRTLAELLSETPGYTPPDLSGHQLVVQPHCHHASVLGWQDDAALLARTGAQVTTLGGCCGLAGNFGVERGHYEVSVAIAEDQLLPAIREAGPGAIVVADGFSCRTQVADLAGRRALTLAELLVLHRERP
ncbi:MAG: FAD-binding and (Fe-S)-binding domain-containing protein [Propionicimonas sp.]